MSLPNGHTIFTGEYPAYGQKNNGRVLLKELNFKNIEIDENFYSRKSSVWRRWVLNSIWSFHLGGWVYSVDYLCGFSGDTSIMPFQGGLSVPYIQPNLNKYVSVFQIVLNAFCWSSIPVLMVALADLMVCIYLPVTGYLALICYAFSGFVSLITLKFLIFSCLDAAEWGRLAVSVVVNCDRAAFAFAKYRVVLRETYRWAREVEAIHRCHPQSNVYDWLNKEAKADLFSSLEQSAEAQLVAAKRLSRAMLASDVDRRNFRPYKSFKSPVLEEMKRITEDLDSVKSQNLNEMVGLWLNAYQVLCTSVRMVSQPFALRMCLTRLEVDSAASINMHEKSATENRPVNFRLQKKVSRRMEVWKNVKQQWDNGVTAGQMALQEELSAASMGGAINVYQENEKRTGSKEKKGDEAFLNLMEQETKAVEKYILKAKDSMAHLKQHICIFSLYILDVFCDLATMFSAILQGVLDIYRFYTNCRTLRAECNVLAVQVSSSLTIVERQVHSAAAALGSCLMEEWVYGEKDGITIPSVDTHWPRTIMLGSGLLVNIDEVLVHPETGQLRPPAHIRPFRRDWLTEEARLLRKKLPLANAGQQVGCALALLKLFLPGFGKSITRENENPLDIEEEKSLRNALSDLEFVSCLLDGAKDVCDMQVNCLRKLVHDGCEAPCNDADDLMKTECSSLIRTEIAKDYENIGNENKQEFNPQIHGNEKRLVHEVYMGVGEESSKAAHRYEEEEAIACAFEGISRSMLVSSQQTVKELQMILRNRKTIGPVVVKTIEANGPDGRWMVVEGTAACASCDIDESCIQRKNERFLEDLPISIVEQLSSMNNVEKTNKADFQLEMKTEGWQCLPETFNWGVVEGNDDIKGCMSFRDDSADLKEEVLRQDEGICDSRTPKYISLGIEPSGKKANEEVLVDICIPSPVTGASAVLESIETYRAGDKSDWAESVSDATLSVGNREIKDLLSTDVRQVSVDTATYTHTDQETKNKGIDMTNSDEERQNFESKRDGVFNGEGEADGDEFFFSGGEIPYGLCDEAEHVAYRLRRAHLNTGNDKYNRDGDNICSVSVNDVDRISLISEIRENLRKSLFNSSILKRESHDILHEDSNYNGSIFKGNNGWVSCGLYEGFGEAEEQSDDAWGNGVYLRSPALSEESSYMDSGNRKS